MAACVIRILLDDNGKETLEMTSKYNPDVVKLAHRLAGRWDKTTKVWYFASDKYSELVLGCDAIYGGDVRVEGDRVSVVSFATAYNTALEYVSAITSLAPELNEKEKEDILTSLLEALTR